MIYHTNQWWLTRCATFELIAGDCLARVYARLCVCVTEIHSSYADARRTLESWRRNRRRETEGAKRGKAEVNHATPVTTSVRWQTSTVDVIAQEVEATSDNDLNRIKVRPPPLQSSASRDRVPNVLRKTTTIVDKSLLTESTRYMEGRDISLTASVSCEKVDDNYCFKLNSKSISNQNRMSTYNVAKGKSSVSALNHRKLKHLVLFRERKVSQSHPPRTKSIRHASFSRVAAFSTT